MHSSEFNDLVDKRLQYCCQILKVKAEEYATHDRLHNFKQAARLQDTTPEQALMGMMAKHIISVVDLTNMNGTPPQPMVDEKITDLINYALLLEAVLKERRDNEIPIRG